MNIDKIDLGSIIHFLCQFFSLISVRSSSLVQLLNLLLYLFSESVRLFFWDIMVTFKPLMRLRDCAN